MYDIVQRICVRVTEACEFELYNVPDHLKTQCATKQWRKMYGGFTMCFVGTKRRRCATGQWTYCHAF